jgi:hypothetical protein
MLEKSKTLVIESPEQLMRVSTRRDFLRVLGMGGAIVMMPAVFSACNDDSVGGLTPPTTTTPQTVTLNLSTDTGILNYAYALEQLEAAFYTAVVGSAAFGSMNAEQQEVMVDLRNHEVIHREFLRAALGSNAIPTLNLNATVVGSTLTTRDVILKNAEMFEDLGVAAYNGAGKYLTNADFLTAAGKIVSVEARHAAAIRDIREALGVTGGEAAGTRFAGDTVVIASGASAGLDVKLEPSAVAGRVISLGIVSDNLSIGTQPTTKAGTTDFGPPSPTP